MAVALRLHVRRKPIPGRDDVLVDFHLTAAPGEVIALTGASGCGKTTTLRIVAGLDRAFDGRLDWPLGPPARIGTVFQEARLLPWRTVRENIAFVRPPDLATALARLDTLGLGGTDRLYPGALSGGMARRVALARALAVEPDLLLLDEPFSALDPETAQICYHALMAYHHDTGCTVLLVTHDAAEAASLADRIVPMPLGLPEIRPTA
ncbi:MAG: ABC transporter ATP-binding protein [Janthinobacterium lividum]